MKANVAVVLIPPHSIIPTNCKPQGKSKHPISENAKAHNAKTDDRNEAAGKSKAANPKPGI